MLINYKNANIYQRHGICVLKNVNFQADEGQFIYLIGRVGSGKTTLMRTLTANSMSTRPTRRQYWDATC